MITKDKVTEIFCIIDEFDKNFESELKKNLSFINFPSFFRSLVESNIVIEKLRYRIVE